MIDDDDDDDTNDSRVTGSLDDIMCCDVTLMTSFSVLNNVAGNTFVVSIADVTEREDVVNDDVIETCDDVTAVCVSFAADETVSDKCIYNNSNKNRAELCSTDQQ